MLCVLFRDDWNRPWWSNPEVYLTTSTVIALPAQILIPGDSNCFQQLNSNLKANWNIDEDTGVFPELQNRILGVQNEDGV